MSLDSYNSQHPDMTRQWNWIGGPRASDALYCRSQVAFDFSSDLQFSLTSCSSHYVSWLSKRIDFLLPGIMTPVFMDVWLEYSYHLYCF